MFNLYKKNHRLVALLPFIILLACGPAEEDMPDRESETPSNLIVLTEAQYNLADISIGTAEERYIGSELQVNGMIDVPPQSKVSINMPYGGFVKYIDMLPGTPVKRGQLLLVVENPDFITYQQEYLESLAHREYLKAEFDRQTKLYEENVASGKLYQQAKSEYHANEARIKSQRERLQMIGFNINKVNSGNVSASVNIYSPVAGAVRDVYTNVGKYINTQDVIMDITNAEDLHVELTVYENDIPKVEKGQRIRFTLANSPGKWREAEVFLVGSGVREDRSVTVHGHLEEENKDLLPGMYITARIETGRVRTWALPEDAFVRYDGKHYVFVYQGRNDDLEVTQSFRMVEAVKGKSEEGYTEVRLVNDSLNVRELQIVTEGAFTLLASAKNKEEDGGGHH